MGINDSSLVCSVDSRVVVAVLQVEHQAVSVQVHLILGLRHLQVKHTNTDCERRENTGGESLGVRAGAQWEHCQSVNTLSRFTAAQPSEQETHKRHQESERLVRMT